MEIKKPKSKQEMPENAKLVFKGKVFDVYQWEQELYDGTKTTFEKLKRPDTVVVFPILPDGRIILTEQEQPGKEPFIAATSGRADEGEDVVSAAKREMLEESGYEARELILWHSEQPVAKIDWSVYLFIAKGLEKVQDLNPEAGEKIKLKIVTFDEFLDIALQDNFYEKEIVPFVYQAKLDPKKMQELKDLFKPL